MVMAAGRKRSALQQRHHLDDGPERVGGLELLAHLGHQSVGREPGDHRLAAAAAAPHPNLARQGSDRSAGKIIEVSVTVPGLALECRAERAALLAGKTDPGRRHPSHQEKMQRCHVVGDMVPLVAQRGDDIGERCAN